MSAPHDPFRPAAEPCGADQPAKLANRSTSADGVGAGPPPPVGEVWAGSPPAQTLCASAPLREPGREPEPRPDLFTPTRRAQFIAALAEAGAVRVACARVGVSAECVYRLRRRDAVFAAAWDGALVLARRVAEDVLAQRALEGVAEPVFYRGEQVGCRVRYDARLLLAHLARLDAHAVASPHGAERAERFDELLAMVAGAGPADELRPAAPTGYPGEDTVDPVLPPDCRAHVERVVARMPGAVSERAMLRREAQAAAAWQAWRESARAVADGLLGAGGIEVKAMPRRADRGGVAPAEASPRRSRARWLRTVSTVSTGSTALGPGGGH